MSAGVRWLLALGPWTSLAAFLWIPMTLPMLVVPHWARRQLTNGSSTDALGQRSGQGTGTGILWLIPASLVVGVLAWVLVFVWITRVGPDHGYFLAPGVIMILGIIVMSLCIPLILRVVPRNALYGIRIPAAYASQQRWYDVNAYGGGVMAAWSVVIVAVGLVGFFVLPRYRDAYISAAVGMSLLGVMFPVAQILWWARRLPAEGPLPRRRRRDFWWAKCLAALPIAFFIKGFVAEVYMVPTNSVAPEVPAQSRVLGWKLSSRFAPGDLITYAHQGHTYLARVSRVENERIWITRNNTPEQALDPENLTGRLLFQYRP
jgi:hypothetical protein